MIDLSYLRVFSDIYSFLFPKPTAISTSLNHLGLLSISGPDAKKFLQGQLTCNLDNITSTQTHLGAHCNPQGRMISLFRIMWFQDQYLLQMPRELMSVATQALKKYSPFFKVNLVESDLIQVGYQGQPLKFFPENIDSAIEEDNMLFIKVPGENCYEIIGEINLVSKFIKTLKATTVDEKTWQKIKISNDIPTLFPETSEKFLPHELRLPQLNGVSFNKGCYTGQEIVARMEYRGKVKTYLVRARTKTPDLPLRGQDIYYEKEPYGTIVDYVSLGYNKYELLILVSEKIKLTMQGSLDPENKFPLELLG